MAEAAGQGDKLNVFISYSRDDLDFADQLDAALGLAGFGTACACNKQISGLKKARLCRVSPGENYAWSAGFFFCERRRRGKGTQPHFQAGPHRSRCGVKWPRR